MDKNTLKIIEKVCYHKGMSKELTDKASVRKRGIKELIGGIVVAAIGGIVSFMSYSTAKVGERYHIYTGVIALGVVYAIKGLIDIAVPAGFGKKGADKTVTANTTETAKETEIVEEDD